MKYFVWIFFALIAVGCKQWPPKPAPEKVKSETEQVVEIIRNQPEWLKMEAVCPTEIFPENEKEAFYSDGDCENDPKACLENCKNEKGIDCYALAILIQRQVNIGQEEANPLFYRGCKFGIISACTNLAAGKFALETADPETLKCSVNTFEKACKKDDPWGCTMFSAALTEGRGREKNLDGALKVLSKSCKYGDDDPACSTAKRLEQSILELKKNKK